MANLSIVTPTALQYDGRITYSEGKSRKTVSWTNKEALWSNFIDKLSKPVRTKETYREYLALPKSDQDDIKDVGGFVGGMIKGGRRKAGNVMNRSMITLDIDFGDDIILDLIEMTFEGAYAIYSTHKHSDERPRLRLVVPLSKNVTSEQYTAVAKKIAEVLGIDYFDDTTYEPHRLMYWPSVSSDGDYVFTYSDAPFTNPDDILGTYTGDWRDPKNWATSSRQEKMYKSMADKQGDPLTKPGLIGTFNRAYDIPSAIETFLSDRYEPAGEGRYTYRGGSTTGGLVLYENGNFAYSHHGTDPTSSKLVNSFDLVRIHLFGAQDDDKDDETPVNRLPSFKSMREFAQKDDAVKRQTIEDKMAEVDSEFDELSGTDAPALDSHNSVGSSKDDAVASMDWLDGVEDDFDALPVETPKKDKGDAEWARKLTLDSSGNIEITISNFILIMQNDPNLKGKIALNEFAMRIIRRGSTPWNKTRHEDDFWTDRDDSGIREYIERIYKLYNRGKMDDAILNVGQLNAFHPVREYIETLEWDGKKRLETLFHTFLGAEDSDINRTVTRKSFTAGVARVMKPGIKFDYMTVLYGPQGVGKSAILKTMAGDWFSDSLTKVEGKEAYEALQGVWIVEMGELAATKRAENESIKQFISKQHDRFRVAYGKHTEDFPRQCVFFGTSNDETFLKDTTGNRRFWPITVAKVKPERHWSSLTQEEIDQIWAEAKYYYEQGENLFLDDADEAVMKEIQASHTEENPWEALIREYLNHYIPRDWSKMSLVDRRAHLETSKDDPIYKEQVAEGSFIPRQYTSAIELWVEALGNEKSKFKNYEQRQINDILKNLDGWSVYSGSKTGKKRVDDMYGVQKVYEREV